ncbi:MAG: SDR family NAD(P)-dependent oxidoreductase [Gammaproteobacteria bacterium]|nr:SDR family NAD(P)-dependent oxidoreductase [Gammaproteobacteria bacterium]
MSNALRVALVTGCSRSQGLGLEVCRQLAEQGITVFLTARDSSRAHALAEELRGRGLDVHDHQLDISSDESVRAIARLIEERHGRLDILVNNATGSTPDAPPVSAVDLESAQRVIDVTLFGTWRLIQATLPLLRKSDAGRIVNVSSSAGLHGDPLWGLNSKIPVDPSYGIGKAALNALTAKLATELRETSIKINAVCPGFTATSPRLAARGGRPVPEGAEGIVWAATLGEDGPSGGFYRDRQLQAW